MYYRIYFECLLPVISQRLPYGVVNALLYALLQVCEAQGQEAVAVDEQSGVGVPLGVCLVNGARFRHIVGIGGSVHLNAGGSAVRRKHQGSHNARLLYISVIHC